MRKLLLLLFIVPTVFLLLSAAEPPNQEFDFVAWIDEVLKGPERRLENYPFDPESSILSRVKAPSEGFMHYLEKSDERDYEAYIPSESEMRTIEEYISLLPPLHQKVLKGRVVEICFIRDFAASGWADWLVNEEGDIYCVLAFHEETLQKELSDWVTQRIKTCFFEDDSKVDLNIDAASGYSGFLGILLHEATHVVDYVKNISPYVEPSTYALALKQDRDIPEGGPFTENIWEDWVTPTAAYHYALRDSVTFYGMGGGPKLGFAEAKALYQQLESTPFVSPFGSRNWADDLAEIVMVYHLTQKLNQPYTVSVSKGRKVIYSNESMLNRKVRDRLPLMEMFYRTDL
jgi:hypothetical protein